MRAVALCRKRGALRDAEAVLLIRYHEPEPFEIHILLDERMCADRKLHRAVGERRLDRALFGGSHGARQKGGADICARKKVFEGAQVLLGEHLGRRHDR